MLESCMRSVRYEERLKLYATSLLWLFILQDPKLFIILSIILSVALFVSGMPT